MQRFIIPFFLIACFCLPASLEAQDRERRREFVEDLLRGLLESQQNQQPPRQQVRPGSTIPGQQPRRPGQPVPRPRPGQPPIIVESSREMIQVRQQLKSWNQVCGQLIQEIRIHENESPQLRPMLADALKVKANIELLSRKAQIYPAIQPLVQDFQTIDSDWRMLSYRLKTSGALTSECSQFLTTISELDTQLCGTFQIQPQINRGELQRLATKLSSDFEHLYHDVYYVVRDKPNAREIMREGKQLQSMIAQSSALIPRGSYDSIVGAYQQCIGKWKGFSRKITTYGDQRIRRSVTDMEATGVMLREQLWLPVEIDRDYLAGMTNDVAKNATRVFDSVSLTNLMAYKAPGAALGAAREFQHACNNFSNSISSGAALEELQWDFRLFEVQWEDMHHMFHEFGISKVDRRLEEIEYSMGTLRQTFGDAPVMDYNSLVNITSNLAALLRQTSMDVHTRVAMPRYDARFHESICSTADQVSGTADLLYQRISRNRNLNLKEADLHQLFVQWRTLCPMINQCKDQDKRALLLNRAQIEPLMVKLQVVFAE